MILSPNLLDFTSLDLRMQVQPVHRNINGHGHLEEERIRRIENREHHHEYRSSTSIRQLVQHRTELRT
jgi:hypothetical protein